MFLFIFSILNPVIIYALDNRGCPTNYAELQSVSGHKEFLAEVARERGYSAVTDAGKVDTNANNALTKMKEAAKKEGKNINEISGYRSYNDQVSTFFARSGVTNPITTCYTGVSNREEAKRQYIARGEASAPPGFSEHHSGKAFDFSPISQSFENTTAFTWLQSNASKYGFKLSYPKGSTQGAGYEPWHWYYIGGGVNETPVGDNNQTGNSATGNTTSPTTTAGTVSYQSYTNFPGVGRISSLCQLINALWLLGFAVLLTSVLGMFLWGGYIYVTAGVNAGKVNQAKEIFTNTITGLIIGLSIFIIINVINPGLLQGNCSIPPIGSTGTGAGQPTFGGGGGTVSGPAFNSGLYTGPSANIGGSAEYHIDTKIPKTTGWETIDGYFLNMARGYDQQGRVIEFSNVGVAGERYDPNAPQSTRIALLQRAAAAHAPRSEHSWDYYIPLKGETRFSKSVEGAEMILPSIPGGRAEYSSGGNYGNYVVVYDSSGRVAYRTGHGDNRRTLPGTKTFP